MVNTNANGSLYELNDDIILVKKDMLIPNLINIFNIKN